MHFTHELREPYSLCDTGATLPCGPTVTLEEGSSDIFANIQSSCANLSTLTTSLYITDAMALKLDATDYPKITTEASGLTPKFFSNPFLVLKVFQCRIEKI